MVEVVNCRGFVFYHFGILPEEGAFDELDLKTLLKFFIHVPDVYSGEALAVVRLLKEVEKRLDSPVGHMALIDSTKTTITHRRRFLGPIVRNENIYTALDRSLLNPDLDTIIYLKPKSSWSGRT